MTLVVAELEKEVSKVKHFSVARSQFTTADSTDNLDRLSVTVVTLILIPCGTNFDVQ